MCQGFLFIIRIRGPPVHKRFHGSRETPNGSGLSAPCLVSWKVSPWSVHLRALHPDKGTLLLPA